MEVTPDMDNLVFGATGNTRIIQKVGMILSTPKGTVPLDRDFGTSWMMVDSPTSQIKARLTAEVIGQIKKYAPEVTVASVTFFKPDVDGRIKPKVTIEIES